MKYFIAQSNEFIDNYKQLEFASAEKKMEAVCTDNYNRLFSIGDDGKFYITYEKHENDTGFEKTNLIASIEEAHKGKTLFTKTFAVAQDMKDESYSLAVAVNIDDKDILFISKEGSVDSPKWIEIAFDDDAQATDISISEIYMSTLNSKNFIIADIVTDNDSKIIKRYFIDINSKDGCKKWIPHPLPADFQKISASTMGRSYKEPVDGIYTLGTIANSTQLIYTPAYNFFNPNIAPSPVRFNLDEKVDLIATLREKSTGYTHLFSCGNGSLYFYPYKEQKDNAKGYKILDDKNLYNIKNLYSYEVNGKKMVWVLNSNGDLFYSFSFASYDNLSNAASWSSLVPVLKNIKYAYAYPNGANFVSNYLAYGYDSIINLGKESTVNSLWTTQKVNLQCLNGPSKKFPSYYTRIEVTDDQKQPAINKEVILTATDSCSVYINNKYYSFTNSPITIPTDERGLIRIVQQADSTVSANFNVAVIDDDSNKSEIDIVPQNKQLDKLTALNTPDKLKNAKTGTGENLVPSDVDEDSLKAVADSMNVFKDVASSLPQDGSSIDDSNNLKAINYSNTSHKGLLVLRFNKNKIESYTGEEAVKNLPQRYLSASKEGFIDKVVYTCGEVINFIKNVAEEVFDIVVTAAKGVWNFVLTIGDKIYSFVVKCISEVVACVEAIFDLIKVTIEAIFNFIKFLFSWKDIERVKDVAKKTVYLAVETAKESMDKLDTSINNMIGDLIKKLSDVADLEDPDGLLAKTPEALESSYTPEENTNVTDMYLTDYFVDNCSDATILTENLQLSILTSDKDENELINCLDILIDAAAEEKDIIKDLVTDLYNNLFKDNKYKEYDLLTIIKKVSAIIAESALASCGNIVSAALDVFKLLLDSAMKALDTPIRIPVVSDILEDVFGLKPFSMLDILCLLPSIAATAVYKILYGEAPIDDETYSYYMALNSFYDIHSHKSSPKNGILTATDPTSVSNTQKVLYPLFHIFAGVVGIVEGVIQIVNFVVDPSRTKSWILFSFTAALNTIDIAIMVGGSFIYSPVELEDDDKFGSGLGIFGYIIIALKGLCDLASIAMAYPDLIPDNVDGNTDPKKKKVLTYVQDAFCIIKAFFSFIEIVWDITSIVYYSVQYDGNKNKISSESIALLLSDFITIFFCDLKDITDAVIPFVAEIQYVNWIVEGLRIALAAIYSLGQIAVGITGGFVIDANDENKNELPSNVILPVEA